MSFDAIFQRAIATSDLKCLVEALEHGLNVDIDSQYFIKVLKLSIKNGDEAAFAKLLIYIPELRLKTWSRKADFPEERGV